MPKPGLIARFCSRLTGQATALRRRGSFGEEAAVAHLKALNYRIIKTNLRSKGGEIDILAIAPDERTVVVVEVKASGSTSKHAYPEMHVNRSKQIKLAKLAMALMKRHRLSDRPVRIDVIAVTCDDDGRPIVRHHENAVEAAF